MAIEIQFPDPRMAENDGLVAVGGELSTEFLLAAYSQGIFPWFNPGEPILWWSPNPRMVLYPHKLKVSKSFRQTLNQQKFQVKVDTQFEEVIRHCAQKPRRNQQGTWLSEDMIEAYCRLHELGYAHSVESYFRGKLSGGLYGLSLGKIFFGESMFYLERDASKVALYYLCQLTVAMGFHLIDVQQSTHHLRSMGGEDIDREEFLNQLAEALKCTIPPGHWNELNIR